MRRLDFFPPRDIYTDAHSGNLVGGAPWVGDRRLLKLTRTCKGCHETHNRDYKACVNIMIAAVVALVREDLPLYLCASKERCAPGDRSLALALSRSLSLSLSYFRVNSRIDFQLLKHFFNIRSMLICDF